VFSLGKQFLRHVIPSIIKPMHALWNELIAFIFFLLGVAAVPSAYHNIRNFDGDLRSIFRVILSCLFAVIMMFFACSSFLRARKISRS
jgi:hypothetical protein